MLFKVLILFSILAATLGQQSTPVSECTQTQAQTPINVYIEGCPTPPCVFPQRQDAVVHVVFQAPRTIRSMRTVATAIVLGQVQEYDLQEDSSTCDFLTNTHCPVLEDEIVFYTLRMYILPIFPPFLPVILEFSVVDNSVPGTAVPIFCLQVPIRVALPSNNLGSNVDHGTLV